MAKQINYKNLLNGFVDTSNAYTSDVNNRLKSLYFYYNMGCVDDSHLEILSSGIGTNQ